MYCTRWVFKYYLCSAIMGTCSRQTSQILSRLWWHMCVFFCNNINEYKTKMNTIAISKYMQWSMHVAGHFWRWKSTYKNSFCILPFNQLRGIMLVVDSTGFNNLILMWLWYEELLGMIYLLKLFTVGLRGKTMFFCNFWLLYYVVSRMNFHCMFTDTNNDCVQYSCCWNYAS
jgi:hypothetical protein